MYDAFIAEWGNNVRQVTRFGGECVAGVAEYEAENNLPIVWGDAHQWINNPIMLGAYDWVQNNPNDPNQLPPRGAIIIWPLPNEHIAFFDHNLDNHQFMSYGQNSGGPLMHFQPHSWNNVAGWYVLKQAAPVVEAHPYTIETIPPKQVIINKLTHQWGLNYDNFTAIANNPVRPVVPGEVITVQAILHHNVGQSYYLPDASNPTGYNIVDCDDYVAPVVLAPAPLPPEPTPYVPPAAPEKIPTSTEPYPIVTPIPGYRNANAAANNVGPASLTVVPGDDYMVFNRVQKDGKDIAVNVTKVQGKSYAWINPNDNVPPPPPPPEFTPTNWDAPVTKPVPVTIPALPSIAKPAVSTDSAEKIRASYRAFYPGKNWPVDYKTSQDIVVYDQLHFGKEKHIAKGKIVAIYGSFVVNGQTYLRPSLPSDTQMYYMYGIPCKNIDSGAPYLDNEFNAADKILYGVEYWYDVAHKTIDGFFRAKKKK